ncbi:MAG TPA: tRNA (adenosine(37)-N6)-threonylcarbamoyltransferase complex transferase subunit TsaD [Nitrospirae bacterium]|nr:tRNA N6-adenosine threonylcarbamoyltransferase [bacterium BMS3Abin10]GBE38460.1 tRNA N6-adenosine threonylcarbamoyltransferase [bacterium BMS3Bbin08]HDH00896.1 tRNA (adenosine(37)-N6)-threonylcarbamoyltransferase complex transferase subunit TsaD [Nitrospirota bacterium]HDH50996.1 tRNA (adenosine(37)-N6)-threonylcarbamoyltransferase complex transferase subunit TsaD [Nitrospirota bacterium]HDO25307.1 tRNA (adenosine(37)-N6)-threonylcarbamoyltransferase complex transferase subunit TsaD [Nitrosp
MLILGVDTSCDDTSAAVVEDGARIISNVVSSQDEIHEKYGGIVPELASRRHIEMIWPVVDEALKKSDIGLKDISAIAVCHGPGLIGSLLVGVCFAKSLAYVNKIPLIAVNHLEGHIFSSFLEETAPDFPFIALVVSGGHTSIYRVDNYGVYTELGRTLDDAAGEAFDKVAKLLGLGYPGGPYIEALSEKGDPGIIPFPRPYMHKGLDFSFSGLKTAVLTHIRKEPDSKKEDIAASFQSAVIDVLTDKTVKAAKAGNVNKIVIAGGVAANRSLRKAMIRMAEEEKMQVCLLPEYLCTDNAAMIASAGFFRFKQGKTAGFDLNPRAYLPLGSHGD